MGAAASSTVTVGLSAFGVAAVASPPPFPYRGLPEVSTVGRVSIGVEGSEEGCVTGRVGRTGALFCCGGWVGAACCAPVVLFTIGAWLVPELELLPFRLYLGPFPEGAVVWLPVTLVVVFGLCWVVVPLPLVLAPYDGVAMLPLALEPEVPEEGCIMGPPAAT